ncbi:unnamed protein product [Mytilus coruscus]|uniref:Peptidase A2 domain-containing protein n=1 Tax=Mytilus coruscus TaxID=42192 RepID=A0A6J8EKE0_MYTCO|nr:unnamed protein product [Mytilus coruscus]
MSNYQPQSHALPVPRQQPPSSGAPQTHITTNLQQDGRIIVIVIIMRDSARVIQTRNKRRSEPAYYRTRDHSRQDFSSLRSVRNSLAHSRHNPRRSLTARESQSESETDSRHSKKKPGNSPVVLGVGSSKSSMDNRLSRMEEYMVKMMSTVISLVQEKSVKQGTSPSSRSPKQDNRSSIIRLDVTMAEEVGGGIIQQGHYKRNCPDLRQNNNRQQPKQLTPKNNPKVERRVEFDEGNFVQDDLDKTSTKGALVGTLGSAHLFRCIVNIQNKEVNALIDTGSEVTILKDSVFDTLAQKPYIIRETTMHGADRDMRMTCRIINPVEFSIQHLIFKKNSARSTYRL